MAKRPSGAPLACAPADYDDDDIRAAQAVAAGVASAGQQKTFLDWVINKAALTYDQPYRPGMSDETYFACGRMFVGQQCVKLLKAKLKNQ